jgi:hypothetical protein
MKRETMNAFFNKVWHAIRTFFVAPDHVFADELTDETGRPLTDESLDDITEE